MIKKTEGGSSQKKPEGNSQIKKKTVAIGETSLTKDDTKVIYKKMNNGIREFF
jgi:hypothetical protein